MQRETPRFENGKDFVIMEGSGCLFLSRDRRVPLPGTYAWQAFPTNSQNERGRNRRYKPSSLNPG